MVHPAPLRPVDLTFTRSSEFGVSHVEGQTDAGIEFVDAYLGSPDIVVADAGRIVVPAKDAEAVEGAALNQGLSVEHRTWP